MENTKGIAALLILAVTSIGCSSRPQEDSSSSQAGGSASVSQEERLATEDAAVLNAVLLSFFDEEAKWQSADWRSGDFVVVRPDWSSTGRSDFYRSLNNAIEWEEIWDEGFDKPSKVIEELKRIRDNPDKSEHEFVPELHSLGELQLDYKIVLSEAERGLAFEEVLVVNGAGKEGSVRVYASVSHPSYAEEGEYASVHLSAPWSRHSANLTFFLKRIDHNWDVFHVSAIFFV